MHENEAASPVLTDRKIQTIAAILCLFIYCNGIFGEFVHDDLSAVTGNPDVQGTTPLWAVWGNDFWGKKISSPLSHKSYRPAVILSFR